MMAIIWQELGYLLIASPKFFRSTVQKPKHWRRIKVHVCCQLIMIHKNSTHNSTWSHYFVFASMELNSMQIRLYKI